jgi:hypothetical protein
MMAAQLVPVAAGLDEVQAAELLGSIGIRE